MASEDLEILARDQGLTSPAQSPTLKRRNSLKSPDAEVALYDVTNNRFQTVKRRDAERLCHQNRVICGGAKCKQ
jgi:hypothetical protein